MNIGTILNIYTYRQGCQVIVNLNVILNSASNTSDDTVNDMDDSIGCYLVTIDNPCTVHSHHLWAIYIFTVNLRYFVQTQQDNVVLVQLNVTST